MKQLPFFTIDKGGLSYRSPILFQWVLLGKATIKAVKMCHQKDMRGAVGNVSLKPTIVAADRSKSAQGGARPSHAAQIDNGMSGIRPGYGMDTSRLCLTYICCVLHIM